MGPHEDRHTERVVYGTDGRREVYEGAGSTVARCARESVVALLLDDTVAIDGEQALLKAPLLGELDGLCADEPFANQPAAAVCTGVLVAPDVVLTAGHCVWRYGCSELLFAFDYAYLDTNVELSLRAHDIHRCDEVLALEVSAPESELQTDYAFVRLDRPAVGRSPQRLAPLFSVREHMPVNLVSAAGGVPLKIDESGRIFDVRVEHGDYFVLSSDAAHGSSGAPVFDDECSVLGILARGREDYSVTPEGCQTALRLPETPEAAHEEATLSSAARLGLCGAAAPRHDLCDSPASPSSANCSSSTARPRSSGEGRLLLLMGLLIVVSRRLRTGLHLEPCREPS